MLLDILFVNWKRMGAMVTGGFVTVTMMQLSFKLLAVGQKLTAKFSPALGES